MQLILKNISKSFLNSNRRINVLNNISFEVKKGSIVSILGHSGVGKTTLLNIIGGLIMPDNGYIKINNSLLENSKKKNKISYLFQKDNLLQEFTVLENMILPLIINNNNYNKSVDIATKLLNMINLFHLKDRYPNELSIGEMQRISLLRCFTNNPEIIIADEPTANLDENNCKQLLDLLVKLNKEFSITYIIATHDLRFKKISSDIYNLFNGEINRNE